MLLYRRPVSWRAQLGLSEFGGSVSPWWQSVHPIAELATSLIGRYPRERDIAVGIVVAAACLSSACWLLRCRALWSRLKGFDFAQRTFAFEEWGGVSGHAGGSWCMFADFLSGYESICWGRARMFLGYYIGLTRST